MVWGGAAHPGIPERTGHSSGKFAPQTKDWVFLVFKETKGKGCTWRKWKLYITIYSPTAPWMDGEERTCQKGGNSYYGMLRPKWNIYVTSLIQRFRGHWIGGENYYAMLTPKWNIYAPSLRQSLRNHWAGGKSIEYSGQNETPMLHPLPKDSGTIG